MRLDNRLFIAFSVRNASSTFKQFDGKTDNFGCVEAKQGWLRCMLGRNLLPLREFVLNSKVLWICLAFAATRSLI